MLFRSDSSAEDIFSHLWNNSQTGEARTTDHVSGLTFVKVLMMEHLPCNLQYMIGPYLVSAD